MSNYRNNYLKPLELDPAQLMLLDFDNTIKIIWLGAEQFNTHSAIEAIFKHTDVIFSEWSEFKCIELQHNDGLYIS